MKIGDRIPTLTNWELIRFEYEVLGGSMENLALSHGVPFLLTEMIAKEKGWKPLTPLTPDNAEGALETVAKSISTLAVLGQEQLAPVYLKAETALLFKLLQFIELLDTDDKQLPRNAKMIADTLLALINLNSGRAVLKQGVIVKKDADGSFNINVSNSTE